MKSKILGGILLIIGTSIGGGMLALPIATAAGGYLHSLSLFLGAWLVTVIAAFFILEVNLWLPEDTNMVSMAGATLGKVGQAVTWFCYLMLLYSLLAAYTAGGADLLQNLLGLIHITISQSLSSVIFVIVFASILFFGVRAVDLANRGLMSVKLLAYLILIVMVAPHVKLINLGFGKYHLLAAAVMVVITSFGYATIIPTLRTYLNSNVKALRLTIAIGSLIPLVCYIAWDFVVQGSLASAGPQGLVTMAHSPHAVSELTDALSYRLNSKVIDDVTHLFTAICITTSFLGVSLCLKDFLSDGFSIKKHGAGRWLSTALTVLPPLAVVLFYPGAFIFALAYAGIFCVVLLMLLPALMAWSGRYVKKIASGYQVMGGKGLIVFEFLVAIALLIYGLVHI
jgi:tyrosine-specific transport protein